MLLIEDDPDRVTLTRRALDSGQAEVEVEVARDEDEALELLFSEDHEREPPDLVLLDLKLPGGSGFNVLERIREEPQTQFVPVVVLTSSRQLEDQRASYRLGANSYVSKPVDYDRFREQISCISNYWLSVNQAPE